MSVSSSPERIKSLQALALFGGVPDEAMKEVIALLNAEAFAAGEVIVHENQPGDRMHLIITGSVEILKNTEPDDSAPARLCVMRQGDAFGEMELIDSMACSASVRALEPVTTLSLSGRDLYRLYKSNPTVFMMIILNLARELSRRLRRMNEIMVDRAVPVPGDSDDRTASCEPART